MIDPTLAADLRQAAQNPESMFPAWVRDELAREADRTDESQERWGRWLNAEELPVSGQGTPFQRENTPYWYPNDTHVIPGRHNAETENTR